MSNLQTTRSRKRRRRQSKRRKSQRGRRRRTRGRRRRRRRGAGTGPLPLAVGLGGRTVPAPPPNPPAPLPNPAAPAKGKAVPAAGQTKRPKSARKTTGGTRRRRRRRRRSRRRRTKRRFGGQRDCLKICNDEIMKERKNWLIQYINRKANLRADLVLPPLAIPNDPRVAALDGQLIKARAAMTKQGLIEWAKGRDGDGVGGAVSVKCGVHHDDGRVTGPCAREDFNYQAKAPPPGWDPYQLPGAAALPAMRHGRVLPIVAPPPAAAPRWRILPAIPPGAMAAPGGGGGGGRGHAGIPGAALLPGMVAPGVWARPPGGGGGGRGHAGFQGPPGLVAPGLAFAAPGPAAVPPRPGLVRQVAAPRQRPGAGALFAPAAAAAPIDMRRAALGRARRWRQVEAARRGAAGGRGLSH